MPPKRSYLTNQAVSRWSLTSKIARSLVNSPAAATTQTLGSYTNRPRRGGGHASGQTCTGCSVRCAVVGTNAVQDGMCERFRCAPQYALDKDKTDYISVLAPGTPKTKLRHPMPISITVFAGQGDEPLLIRIGTAYEAATHHRTPPPDFGSMSVKPHQRNRAAGRGRESVRVAGRL